MSKRTGRLIVSLVCGAIAGQVAFQFARLGGSPWLIVLPISMLLCMFGYGILSWGWD